jgi:hypothetical protein
MNRARSILFALLAACSTQTPTSEPAAPEPNADHAIIEDLIKQGVLRPRACGGGSCTNSSSCQDILSRCRYCYLGGCSEVLPAGTPDDAGVDTKGTP